MGLLKGEDVSFLLCDGPHTLRMYRSVGTGAMDNAVARFTLTDGEQVTVAYRPSLVAGQGAALKVSGCDRVATEGTSMRSVSAAASSSDTSSAAGCDTVIGCAFMLFILIGAIAYFVMMFDY